VADGLDRGHVGAVKEIRTALDGKRLVITALPARRGADIGLECWSAGRKGDVLGKVLGVEVEVGEDND
jgi:hypothetical protein